MEMSFGPVEVTARNGRLVHVRAVTPADEEEILQAFERLSSQSRYMRYMHTVREPNTRRLREALASFPGKGLAIAATVTAADGIDIVGMATCIVGADPKTCEFAISVADDWAGAGLGRSLMTLLIAAAGRRGLATMEGFVLADNAPMLRLAQKLGFETKRDPDDYGVRICRLSLPTAPPALGP